MRVDELIEALQDLPDQYDEVKTEQGILILTIERVQSTKGITGHHIELRSR